MNYIPVQKKIENILMMIPFGVLLQDVLKHAESIFCCIPLGLFRLA